MPLPPSDGAAEPPQAAAQNPARVVVVVPRKETRLHEYLLRSLAALKDVDVVLDRRAAAVTPLDERRRRPPRDSERPFLICSLVRCPVESPAPAPPESSSTQAEPGRHHTLLWPGLRLEHL